MREGELLQKAHSNICLLPALWESEPPMQQAPCKYATGTVNAGTLLEEATFPLEYFIQNKDLVVKQTHLNDAHREKLDFGQKKLAAVPAIYKNQSQPKHSSGLSSASSWGTQRKFDVYWKPGYCRGCSLARIAWKPVLKLNAKMPWQFSHWLAILLSQCMCLLLCCLFLTGCNYLSCFWLRFL